MSSVLNKGARFLSRLRCSLGVFFLLVMVGLILVVGTLGYLHYQMQMADSARAQRLVADYLKKGAAHQVQIGSFRSSYADLNTLGELAFVRFIRGGEHILLANEEKITFDVNEIMHLAADLEGTWVLLDGHDTAFTLVVGKISGVFQIQAAVIAENYPIYIRIAKNLYLALAIYSVLCSFLAVGITKKSYSSLEKTSAQIAALVNNSGSLPLSVSGNEPEINQLHSQINSLVLHNRTLISVIQGSLDNVAHDLRTPVTRLRSVAEYGLQSDDEGKLRSALADCLEESEQIAAMLRIMMSVAEAESGTMSLHRKVSEVFVGIQDAVELYEYVAEEKEIVISVVADERPFANIDPVRMRQVWANLLDNGIKYGKVGGHVTITLSQEMDSVIVRFQDNGIGVSESEQHKIWERLYRGDRSRSEKGLGLGLNYVKAVVEAHGGTVHVASTLHQGSCFEVRLPAVQATPPQLV